MNQEYVLKIHEGQRQMLVLALAELALSRPGWDEALREIAKSIDTEGTPMYEHLKALNADRVREQRGPMTPLIAERDHEDIRRWLYGVTNGEPVPARSFLISLAATALMADDKNYPLLRPVILLLKAKFPNYRFDGTF